MTAQYTLCQLALLSMPFAIARGPEIPVRDSQVVSPFLVGSGARGLTSLRRSGSRHNVEFIQPGKRALGEVIVRYRSGELPWQTASTTTLEGRPGTTSGGDDIVFELSGTSASGLRLEERFRRREDALVWTIRLRNGGQDPLEIGDIALPLPMHTTYPRAFGDGQIKNEIFTRRLMRHSFISGHGSFVYWLPVNGEGTHLVMVPLAGTKLEYFEEPRSDYAHGGATYVAYIHSAASRLEQQRGTWRQPRTSVTLAPGQDLIYGFAFRWAEDLRGVRDMLYRHGGFDTVVVPGMVVPEDLFAMFSLRTRNRITAVTPEFPTRTTIRHVGDRRKDTYVYQVRFRRLGENLLTVHYEGGRSMVLEFFVTQPLETLIRKRAAFITRKQQHRDPSKWYDGLFSLWDVRLPEGENLLGPDNLGGQHRYAVSGSDDPCTAKPVYLSQKNVVYPDREEIRALEYFLERFVWGGHQRADKERPYPYGIYGADSWHENRFAERDPLEKQISRPGGPSQCRMWRTFDYPHYIALYYNLYRIAKAHPHLVEYLDAAGYLERAYGTARAFYEVPYNIHMQGGWSFTGWTDWAYKIGNFHEKYLLPLIDALEQEGHQEKAEHLRGEWEKKVKYFLYDDAYPFVSEMPVDSTAYESTYAIARYALTHELKPDDKLWRDKNTGRWYSHRVIDPEVHRRFLEKQLLANIADRGWLETNYYHLGSDFRGCGSSFYTLSYMTQMGGWSILDHALRFADEPAELLRLGYASMLATWALMNAGSRETNFGFWRPGKRHDGAIGWGFMPQKFGHDWNPATKGIPRGAWPVDGEIDHGLTAYVEAARTVVSDDPLFGLFAYGGEVIQENGLLRVTPRDGVRQRLHVVRGRTRFFMELTHDGFARDRDIVLDETLRDIRFVLESRAASPRATRLRLGGLRPGTYTVSVAGKRVSQASVGQDGAVTVAIPSPAAPGRCVAVAVQSD